MASSPLGTASTSNKLEPALELVQQLLPDELRHLLRLPCIQTRYQVRPVLFMKKKGKVLQGLGPSLKPLALSSTQISGSEAEMEAEGGEEIDTAAGVIPIRGRARKRARVLEEESPGREEGGANEEGGDSEANDGKSVDQGYLVEDSTNEDEEEDQAGELERRNLLPAVEMAASQKQASIPSSIRPAEAIHAALLKDVAALPRLQDVEGRVRDLLRHMEMFGSKEAVQQLFEVFRGQQDVQPNANSPRDAPRQSGQEQALIVLPNKVPVVVRLLQGKQQVAVGQAASAYLQLAELEAGQFRTAVMRRMQSIIIARHVEQESQVLLEQGMARRLGPGETHMARAISQLFSAIHHSLIAGSDPAEYLRQKKALERRLAMGRHWNRLVGVFGTGVLLMVPGDFPESWWSQGLSAELGEIFMRHLPIVRTYLGVMCEQAQQLNLSLFTSVGMSREVDSPEQLMQILLRDTGESTATLGPS